MTKRMVLVGLAMVWTASILALAGGARAADEPATFEAARPAAAEKPVAVTGTLARPQDTEKLAAAIGHWGVRLFRCEAEWNEFVKVLPDLAPDSPLPKLDFTKQSLVMVYTDDCRSRAKLELGRCDLAASPAKVEVLLTWDNTPEEQREFRYAKFILAAIPAAPAAQVTVMSLPLIRDRSRPEAEFSAVLGGKDGGDVVDGLQSVVTPKAPAVQAGDDILVDFELHLAALGEAKPQALGPAPRSVFVWDGKYSNGYRNHAFIVTTPDGKTTVIRPKAIMNWEKNIPHPVEIAADKPYHIPTWTSATGPISLRALGLNTSAPGLYTIAGLYQEAGGTEGQKTMWGGMIVSNTITVEVRGAAKEGKAGGETVKELIAATKASGDDFRGLTGKDRAVLYTVAANTGLRESELASLTPESFDLSADTPTVRCLAGYTKNGEEAVLPLRADVAATAREYLSGRTAGLPIWPGSWAKSRAGGAMMKDDVDHAHDV